MYVLLVFRYLNYQPAIKNTYYQCNLSTFPHLNFYLKVYFQSYRPPIIVIIYQFFVFFVLQAHINIRLSFPMQKIKREKSKIIKIPPLHTYLIKQYQTICQEFKINLLNGSAEIHGIEIKKHYPHTYKLPCSVPIFTWDSCEIQVDWKQQDGNRSSDDDWCDLTQFHSLQNPILKYLQLHYQLTCLRKLALESIKEGPRLAITGSQNSGIQMCSKLLLNYTGKLNMKPIFIDLDIQNSIFIDGTLGVLVFQYKICEDFYDRPQKICFFYGNRKSRKNSFLKIASLIAKIINKKIQKELKSFKDKGSADQYPVFCSGIILQCPRIMDKQDKKSQRQILYQLFKIFNISHVLSVDDPEISAYLSKSMPKIQKFNFSKLQGANSFLQVPRPIRSKINRYFQPQLCKKLSIKISEIHLYQLIEQQNQYPYCRQVKVQQEPIAKSTIAILHCDNIGADSRQERAQKALNNPISCLAFIDRIDNEEITLQVINQHFLQECKNKLWLSMISQNF